MSLDKEDGCQSSMNMCKPCVQRNIGRTADFYCMNCNEFQCSDCSKYHAMFEITIGHELVTATQVETLRPVIDSCMKEFVSCSNHKHRFAFFCVDHDTLCCSMCVSTQHRTCKEVNDLSKEAKKAKLNASILSELDEPVNEVAWFLEDTKASVDRELDAVVDKIEEMNQSVNKKFKDIKEYVSDHVKEKKLKINNDLHKKLCMIKSISNDIAKSKQLFAPVFEKGSEEEKFIIFRTLKQKQVSYRTTLQENRSFNRPTYSYKR